MRICTLARAFVRAGEARKNFSGGATRRCWEIGTVGRIRAPRPLCGARRGAWHGSGLDAEPRVRAFAEQLERVQPVPRIPEWERIAARIAQHAEMAIRGRETIEEALQALDRETDEILEKRRWLLERSGERAQTSSPIPDRATGARESAAP